MSAAAAAAAASKKAITKQTTSSWRKQFCIKIFNLRRMTSFFLLPLAWITSGRRRRRREYLRKIKSMPGETEGERQGDLGGKKKERIPSTKVCLNMQKWPVVILEDTKN